VVTPRTRSKTVDQARQAKTDLEHQKLTNELTIQQLAINRESAEQQTLERKHSAELRKLEAEAKSEHAQSGILGYIARVVAPAVTLLTAIITTSIGVNTIGLQQQQMEIQRRQQASQTLSATLSQAMDASKGKTSQLAAVMSLAQFWPDQDSHRLLSNSLTALLVNNGLPDDVREATVDVIDQALEDSSSQKQDSTRLALTADLYGDATAGTDGAVSHALRKITSELRSCRPIDKPGLERTRQYLVEAVRRNWECLRFSNLQQVALSPTDASHNTDLYCADLHGANFRQADIQDVTFAGANLSYCDFREVAHIPSYLWLGANIRGISDGKLRQIAIQHGAVNLSDSDWQSWKKAGFWLPGHVSLLHDFAVQSNASSRPASGASIEPDLAALSPDLRSKWDQWSMTGFKLKQGVPVETPK